MSVRFLITVLWFFTATALIISIILDNYTFELSFNLKRILVISTGPKCLNLPGSEVLASIASSPFFVDSSMPSSFLSFHGTFFTRPF